MKWVDAVGSNAQVVFQCQTDNRIGPVTSMLRVAPPKAQPHHLVFQHARNSGDGTLALPYDGMYLSHAHILDHESDGFQYGWQGHLCSVCRGAMMEQWKHFGSLGKVKVHHLHICHKLLSQHRESICGQLMANPIAGRIAILASSYRLQWGASPGT